MSHSPDVSLLENLPGWGELKENARDEVKNETIAAYEDRKTERESRLSLGKRLSHVRSILEPVGGWVSWCHDVFNMSVATAYRYIKNFQIVSNKVPKPVLTVALQLGYELPAKKIESSRPPKSQNQQEIVRYLERINSSTKSKVVVIEHNPDDVLKVLLNEFILGFNKLPKIPRTRTTAFTRLVGMMMTQTGFTKPMSFEPVAIPDRMRVHRGRPTTKRQAA